MVLGAILESWDVLATRCLSPEMSLQITILICMNLSSKGDVHSENSYIFLSESCQGINIIASAIVTAKKLVAV